jgi:hypothetical protein
MRQSHNKIAALTASVLTGIAKLRLGCFIPGKQDARAQRKKSGQRETTATTGPEHTLI